MKWFWYAFVLAAVVCCSCSRRVLTKGSEECAVDAVAMRSVECSRMESATDQVSDSTVEVFWEKWMVDARGELVLTDKEHKKLRWGNRNKGVKVTECSADSVKEMVNERSRHAKEKEVCDEELSSKPPDVLVVVFVLIVFGAVFLYIRFRR